MDYSFLMTELQKIALFDETKEALESQGFSIQSQDQNRPWGGFFVLAEGQINKFIDLFFDKLNMGQINLSGKLSPKILVVAPNKRLSWQYHNRRAELWRVVQGEVEVVTSVTDEETDSRTLGPGEYITLKQGERHRLIGLNDWGVVAEIWQHTDPLNPSDEEDIVRVQDDFGR
ncbi:phosphoheptose isomerase [Adhaeribacter terreus]|uniref:Phosphoheptose isomerase n=1 Tax=Adhaeribacter terreus TaxID=529703 RepID=A0ABW0E622_9BACT